MQPPSQPFSYLTGQPLDLAIRPCLVRDVRILRDEFRLEGLSFEDAHKKARGIVLDLRKEFGEPLPVGDRDLFVEKIKALPSRQSGPQQDQRHWIDDGTPLDRADERRRENESSDWGTRNV